MLYDANLLNEDQLKALNKDSKKSSNKNNDEQLDFSLLTDGLQAEHEQGITMMFLIVILRLQNENLL